MKTINVGVIGLGYWGPNLVRNFNKIPGAQVLMACDLQEKNIKIFARDFPFIKTTTDYRDILSNQQIDVVAVATPPEGHFSIGKHVLFAKKHLLIEKPFTKTSKEAKELISLAKQKDRLIMIDHTFVYSSAVQKIKQMLSKNVLGKVYYYDSLRINLGLIHNDSNVIWDLAPHDLSILSYIFKQKPISLQAFGSSHIQRKTEEMAHILIRYEENITAHIHVSWLSPVKIRTVFIGGSKKMIYYDDIAPSEKIKIYDKGIEIPHKTITPFSPAYRSGDVIIPRLDQTEPLFNALSHFIYCIRYKKKPITGGEEGLKIVKLLEATDIALKKKSEIAL